MVGKAKRRGRGKKKREKKENQNDKIKEMTNWKLDKENRQNSEGKRKG